MLGGASLEQWQHQATLDTYMILTFAMQMQLPIKPLNPLSTQIALLIGASQLLSHRHSEASSLQAPSPSPALQTASLQRFS